jgi:hypothetical protein
LIILWKIGKTVEKAAGSPVKRKIQLLCAKRLTPGTTKTRLCPPFILDEAAMIYPTKREISPESIDFPQNIGNKSALVPPKIQTG